MAGKCDLELPRVHPQFRGVCHFLRQRLKSYAINRYFETPFVNHKSPHKMAEGTYRLYQGNDEQWYFSLRAPNKEVILQSEGYVAIAGAENGIESVRAHCTGPGNYDFKESSNGQFYFTLNAANHQVIGVSEMYTTRGAANDGAESVMRWGPVAPVVQE